MKKMSVAFLFVISLNSFGVVADDNLNKPVTTRFKELKEYENAPRLIEASNKWDARGKQFLIAANQDELGTQRSFTGDYFGAIEAFNMGYKLDEKAKEKWGKSSGKNSVKTDPSDQQKFDDATFINAVNGATAQNAIASILNQAKNKQIVILNEAHHVSAHRAFAMRLARELRKIGFEYLACEAFTNFVKAPLAKEYVSEDTGYFTKDPMYANFLNDAIHDHWKFVSYEPDEGPREYAMAKNLVDRIFKLHPKAKVFIYVGYGHVEKIPNSTAAEDQSMFAAQLKRLTGIDPLAIDQATMYQHCYGKRQCDLYKSVLSKQIDAQPFVLLSPQNTFVTSNNDQGIDIQVIHPAYDLDGGTHRASWLSSLAGFSPYEVPKKILPTQNRRLIYAYRANDPPDAVPADVIMVEHGKPIPMLMLPKGEYRYSFED